MNFQKFWITYLKWPIFVRLSVIVLFIIILFGFYIHQVEPKEFPTIFDGIWWAIVTMSTVGYGDLAPETGMGRLVGVILIFVGASFITTYFASLSAATIQKQNERINGTLSFTGSQHIIVIGWSEKSNELIQMLRIHEPYRSIVLVDASLEQDPIKNERLYFVKGSPMDESTLKKANIKQAQAIFVTADQHKSELHADMQSISILLNVKGLNPSIYTVCEILTETQTNNAFRAGANELIKTYKLTSQIMMSSYLAKSNFSQIITELCPANSTFLMTLPVSDVEVGKTFADIHNSFFQKNKIVFGVKRGEDLTLNPPHDYVMTSNDVLIVLKS